jgi:Na+-driven multidrug efflux pump
VINAMLAGLPNETSAIAAYSIYYRVMMFAAMPMIAISVAMLPFAAKRIGASDFAGLRAGLWQAGVVAVLYAVAIVGPVMFLWGGQISRWLAEAPLTAQYTRFGLWMVPVASLAIAPFLLCRPVFEAMGRGRPGLIMAIFRYIALTIPAAYAGMHVARVMGQPAMYGILVALVGVAAVSSLVFALWLRQALAAAMPREASQGAANGSRSLEVP